MLLRNRQKSKGFTLIELLVAVGVFFILFLITSYPFYKRKFIHLHSQIYLLSIAGSIPKIINYVKILELLLDFHNIIYYH